MQKNSTFHEKSCSLHAPARAGDASKRIDFYFIQDCNGFDTSYNVTRHAPARAGGASKRIDFYFIQDCNGFDTPYNVKSLAVSRRITRSKRLFEKYKIKL